MQPLLAILQIPERAHCHDGSDVEPMRGLSGKGGGHLYRNIAANRSTRNKVKLSLRIQAADGSAVTNGFLMGRRKMDPG